ncbi:alpha/beta fold hydrolase [Marinicella sediminis]|uniref:Alpha/beta fold hydrolase n=1 Tax=Marinicella sediminis TaxID=1792834 RepID=A0ABV7JCC8_9GAMM
MLTNAVHHSMFVWPLIKTLLSAYLLLMLAVYLLQNRLIYHPPPTIEHPHQTLQLTTAEATINAVQLNPQGERVLLYLGGNAEQVAYSASDFLHHLPNTRVLLMQYRGYGGSGGSPSEAALFADALALFDHLQGQTNHPVTVMGRSLGSGIATYVASQREVAQLILVTPFDSLRAVAAKLMPILPVNWMPGTTTSISNRLISAASRVFSLVM